MMRNPFDPLDGPVSATFDMHGVSAAEAPAAVASFIRTSAIRYPGGLVHIITGKGRRSVGGPVLKGLVRRILQGGEVAGVRDWGRDLDDGGFLVRLK